MIRMKGDKYAKINEISETFCRIYRDDCFALISAGVLRTFASVLHIQYCECGDTAERYRGRCAQTDAKRNDGASEAIYE